MLAHMHELDLARLDQQLRAAFEGPAWHGPAVLEVLEGVTAAQASARPIAGAHSIWELTLHVAATYRLVLRRLDGEARNLSTEEDWPPVPAPSEENWRESVAALRRLNIDVRRRIGMARALDLDRPLVAESPHTAFTQFVGITQHDLYHAGQMALLKKALGGK
jgi:uncharacterized damage-inducible protein DinB